MSKKKAHKKHFSEQGVAVILVTVALVLMANIGFEFSTRTNTDVMAAVSARDDMRAHFLARSGANLAQMMIRVQSEVLDRNRRMLGDVQIADFSGFFMGAFGGSEEEVQDLAAMLGGFDGEKIKGLGADVGNFDLDITHEDGKINMNCANGSNRSKTALKGQLEALLFHNSYDRLFESPTADGWRRDRNEQISALIDYIDRDTTRFDAPGTPEDYGYQTLEDRFLPKNNYLDSIGELKLVRGVDDRFWTLFGNQFTIYGDCRINLGSVRDPRLLAAVIYLSAKNPEDPVLRDPTGQKLLALATQVQSARSLGMFIDDLNAFAQFVGNPSGIFGDAAGGGNQLMALLGGQQAAEQAAQSQIEGVELDMKKLQEIATIGPRRVYRIEVTASVGLVNRRLTAIWDNNTQNQNARDPAYNRGTWVFWKVE